MSELHDFRDPSVVIYSDSIMIGDPLEVPAHWSEPVHCDCGNAIGLRVDTHMLQDESLARAKAICRLCGRDVMDKVRALLAELRG